MRLEPRGALHVQVVLPVVQQVLPNETNSNAARRFCVLVVDDDPNIRRMIIASLRREGYGFLEASNGREALDHMRASKPDVVVLDLMMPFVSGWDVLRERREEEDLKAIPVIIVSANRDPEVATAVDEGICAFLPKPFDIGALSALVRNCLVPITAEDA